MTLAAGSASATQILVFCGSFSASAGGGTFTSSNGVVASGVINCGAANQASIGAGNTLITEGLILQTDYTASGLPVTNTINTAYTPSTFFSNDTLTATGTGGSSSYSDLNGNNPACCGLNASNFTDIPLSSSFLSAFTVGYSASVTTGAVQGLSGNVYEVLTYTSAAPEPTAFILMGAGLGLLGMLRRKAVRR
jgi:hypothetical protein